MKIDFYFDWWPGMNLEYANASHIPSTYPTLGKRYKFTVEIDDPNSPDIVQEVKASQEPKR